jgi:hypothetical protein
MDLTSPARLGRHWKLEKARELTRAAQIENAWELLAAMQNLHASVSAAGTITNDFAGRLLELITDLDTELRDDEPELTGCDKRGEFDGLTQGVRGRA